MPPSLKSVDRISATEIVILRVHTHVMYIDLWPCHPLPGRHCPVDVVRRIVDALSLKALGWKSRSIRCAVWLSSPKNKNCGVFYRKTPPSSSSQSACHPIYVRPIDKSIRGKAPEYQ